MDKFGVTANQIAYICSPLFVHIYSKVVLMYILSFYPIVIDFSYKLLYIFHLYSYFFAHLSIAPPSVFDMSIVQILSFVFFPSVSSKN